MEIDVAQVQDERRRHALLHHAAISSNPMI
jgi:hypothetical protein